MNRILAALMLTAAGAAPALADTAIGLTGDKTLVMIDTATAAVTGTVDVQGVDRLFGIDYRPANGTLVGVTSDYRIVTIDAATGVSTDVAMINTPFAAVDGPVVVDFNPMADRLRFMTGTTNHRIHPDTGEATVDGSLAFLGDDANAAAAPMVGAAAYINSYGTPEATAMYNIDTALSALVQQAPPNDGTIKTIGALGVTLDGPVGFDVATTAEGVNTAWLAANGGLHTVDLATGALTASWPITDASDAIRDLVVMPVM